MDWEIFSSNLLLVISFGVRVGDLMRAAENKPENQGLPR